MLILSLTPGDNLDEVPKFDIPHLDKIIHFLMYLILTSAVIIDFRKNTNISKKRIYFTSLISILIFSGAIELIQGFFIDKRSGDILDLLANFTGIIFAIYLNNSRVGEWLLKKLNLQ